jgi:zinc transport system substrate-binding protein
VRGRAAIAIAWLSATACVATPDRGRTDVVAAFFPIADTTQRITGSVADVTNVTPAGAEPHDLELTSDALDQVLDADLVIYLRGFQPALDDALRRSDARKLDLLGSDETADPHIWLDPDRWVQAVERISEALQALSPARNDEFIASTRVVIGELRELDTRYREGLASCARDLIVTTHDAFGRLADRYGVRVESIAGVSPEAEPDPRRLSEIADLVREEGVTTVFSEELVSPEVAETVAQETGARVDVLDPIESDPDGGYEGAMRRNLTALRRALGCR